MSNSNLKIIVFTDLDGTLLERATYSFEKALPAIRHLLDRDIPIVFCSAKTRAEQEVYQQKLGIHAPFIVENGGAVFIPRDYFTASFRFSKSDEKYRIIELGVPYAEIRHIIEELRIKAGIDFRGYGDMSAGEVAAITGLDLEGARHAKKREYSETLILDGTHQETQRILDAIQEAGLDYTHGGSYYTVTGSSDKGKASSILMELFHQELGQIKVVGIGDSLNDLPMLSVVDVPFLVQKPEGYWEEMDIPPLRRVEGAGPAGWSAAIREITGT